VYILCWKFCNFVVSPGVAEDASGRLIIVHLECLSPNDLEPMDEGLDTGVGIEVCVRYDLLLKGNVLACPTEQEVTGDINHSDKDRGISH